MSAALARAQARIDATIWPALNELPAPVSTESAPFPFDGLGAVLGTAARAIAEGVQAPDALAGGSVLAAAALAVQAHADIMMPHGQRSPLSVFVVTAALSGDRKTATDSVANRPTEDYRREQARHHFAALQEFERTRVSRKKGGDQEAPPAAQSLIIAKATVEGLHAMLRSQSHVGLFTGEGGELLGGYSLRPERRSAGLAWFLKAWGAETIDTLTSGEGLSILLGRRVSLHAMVQPVLLRALLGDPLAQGQGFLARCLVAEPASLAGSRLFRAGDPMEAPAVKAYHAAMRHLLLMPTATNRNGDGHELETRVLQMSVDATALWIEYHNQIEREQKAGAALGGARAFASKAAEHAARIAGIVQIFGDPSAVEVSVNTMEGAIEVASFYIAEHVRLTGAGIEDHRLGQLRTLLSWFRNRAPLVPTADVLQMTPRSLRDLQAAGLRPLLDELAQRGYIRPAVSGWEVRP